MGYLLENDRFCAWFNHTGKLVDARHPAIRLIHLLETNINTTELWQGIQLPEGWVLANDVITGATDSVEDEIVRHNRARCDEDIVHGQFPLIR